MFLFSVPWLDGQLITDQPRVLVKSRRPIPIMLGVTKNESGYMHVVNKTFDQSVHDSCELAVTTFRNVSMLKLVANECARFYSAIGDFLYLKRV